MFSRTALRTARASRAFSTTPARHTKVAVLGAGGGIGQPLSLLLKSEPLVSNLSLYDIRGAPGVAADVGHIDSAGEVTGYAADKLDEALQGVEVVVIPAGVPRKKPSRRDKILQANEIDFKSVYRNLDDGMTLLLPFVSNYLPEEYQLLQEFNRRLGTKVAKYWAFMAAPELLPESLKLYDLHTTGHDFEYGETGIDPIYGEIPSRCWNFLKGHEDYSWYDKKAIAFPSTSVFAAPATLSMAYTAAKFTNLLLRVLKGEAGIVIPTFVKSPRFTVQGIKFFSSAVELGPSGVKKIHDLGNITAWEQELVDTALPELKKKIKKG
ncbi:hypothetical protein M422DRAFT_126304, partial [Sphaerobolus stellatus SS14]